MLMTLVKLDSRVSDMSMSSKVAPSPKVDSNSSGGKIPPRGGRLRGSAWSYRVDLVKAPKHAGRRIHECRVVACEPNRSDRC